MKRKAGSLLLTIVLGLTMVGCIHKTGGTVTPMERFSTDWAVFGEFLRTAEQGTQAAQLAGVITVSQARPIIQFEQKVAENHASLTPLIQQGQAAISSSQALQAFLGSVGTDAQQLVKLDVKNPKTQQTISADIQYITSLAQVIVNDVLMLKGAGQ